MCNAMVPLSGRRHPCNRHPTEKGYSGAVFGQHHRMGDAIRVEDEAGVRHLVLCRPGELNTITLGLRDELDAALDAADRDNSVRVVLLRAEGRAFCAGFGLDWSTAAQAGERPPDGGRVWDTVADVRMIGLFGNTFAKL